MRTGVIARIINALDTVINPATEEKQDDIITAVDNISGLQRSTDLDGGGSVTIGTTQVEVTFSGTPESIVIRADEANTGSIWIGKTGVTNSGGNAFALLYAGDILTIDYKDTSNALYAISDTASQTIWKGALI